MIDIILLMLVGGFVGIAIGFCIESSR